MRKVLTIFFVLQFFLFPALVNSTITARALAAKNNLLGDNRSNDINAVAGEFQQIRLALISDNDPLKPGDKGFNKLIDRAWQLSGQWAILYLQQHKDASEQDLTDWLCGLDNCATGLTENNSAADNNHHFDFKVIKLAAAPQAAYVVAANWFCDGTIFIVSANEKGMFQISWPLIDNQKLINRTFKKNFEKVDHEEGESDIAFTYDIVSLPANRKGQARFYARGTFYAEAGSDIGQDFSIWQWDGNKLQILLAEDYSSYIDEASTAFDGNKIEITTLDYFKKFFNCDFCDYTKAVWRIEIGLDAVKDLGKTRKMPEIFLIDKLLNLITKHQDVNEIASPTVVGQLRKLFQDYDIFDDQNLDINGVPELTKDGDRTLLKISIDELPPLTFTIIDKNGQPFVQSLIVEEKAKEE